MSKDTVGIPLLDVLKLNPLSEAIVLGGHAGLSRVVTTVNVMETDDAFRFLCGNELLITAFYAVRDDLNAQLRWLDELAQRGCAGLIVCYIGRYFKADLDALIRRADQLAFPLLTIPDEKVVYSDIITSVLTELLQQQTTRLEYALSVHERLTHQVLMGASLEALIRSLSELLRSTVIMTDAKLNVTVSSAHGHEGRNLLAHLLDDEYWQHELQSPNSMFSFAQLTRRLESRRKDWERCLDSTIEISVQPIQVERTLVGYLIAFKCGEALTKIQDYALQVGVTVIALERMRAISIRETERRLQGDFLDDLLSRSSISPEIIKRQALALGIDIEDRCAVMVIGIDEHQTGAPPMSISQQVDHTREAIFHLIENTVHRESHRNVVVTRGSRILVLVGTNGSSSSLNSAKEKVIALGENILKETRSYLDSSAIPHPGTELCIGVSGSEHNYATLHQGYADALRALEIGQRLLGPGHIMHISDTHFYSLLDSVAERKESHQIITEVLAPLQAYDQANGTDLMKTLELLCLSGEDNTEVARRLYIHRNTLIYRQARIRDLLGFDPFSGQGRTKAQFALMLNKLIETQPN